MASSTITEAATSDPTAAQVAQVRAFNRFYTNVIGVLHGMYLDTPFTLTEGRLLFEIARQDAVEVSDLRRALDIAGRIDGPSSTQPGTQAGAPAPDRAGLAAIRTILG